MMLHLGAWLLLATLVASHPHASAQVIRMAPQSNLTVLDPGWTTAYITRNHGYMIYDTLFGMDGKGKIQPQMVDRWSMSKDKRVWSFTLRDGLAFHDGKPVTGEDVIASLSRWSKRDAMGERLYSFVDKVEADGAKGFRMTLREPYGLVLESLGKPSSYVPFIMPKRVADTPADKQISEYVGSGPFVFAKDEWKPGEKVVYLKNTRYRPRSEPASGTAGGKVVKVDKVEWLIIKDAQTQANALAAGEIDMIETPAFEIYESLKKNPQVQIVNTVPLGYQAMIRFNHLHPPFDNAKVRQAAMAALNQPAFLRTQVGVSELYRTCFSIYPCKTPYESGKGMDFIAKPDMKRAQQLLKESGYDGTPIVIMQPSDLLVIAKLPVVGAQLLRHAGFKVDLQAMDWQTLLARRAKKDPPLKGGWNVFFTVWASVDAMLPVGMNAVNANCDKAWFGWPCDPTLENLLASFARTEDDKERRSLAEQVQVRAMEIGTHAPLGEYLIPVAARKNLKGFVTGYVSVMWNLTKQ
ncbi:MAG: ABC transporter substrate-binding protein [Betaproteobacteria bacterium]|nr:ABC transporter substrate-binding protein [Betaproteobacteria bacterium]